MQVLFLHNNFPAQFGGLAHHLRGHGWDVWFGTQRKDLTHADLNTFHYSPHREPDRRVHAYSTTWERAVINGQSVARACIEVKKSGLNPDLVVSHSGWGPGMFVKDIFPGARTIGYFEWYYNSPGPDVQFLDPTPPTYDHAARSRARNAPILLDLASVDLGICPTHWQQSQFPDIFRKKMIVHHDGVDTEYYKPGPKQGLELPGISLSPETEIVTYVARGMEPYRGFPQFMAALEKLQKRRKNVHAVIVGDDRVAYGKKLEEGDSHLRRIISEIDLDCSRTHFTGFLSREQYTDVIRASSLHVYLTVPFVLSWSMMEAMSSGCLLVGSDTVAVREVANESNAIITDFHDPEAIAAAMDKGLSDPTRCEHLRKAARKTIVEKYSAIKILEEKRRIFTAVVNGKGTAKRKAAAA